ESVMWLFDDMSINKTGFCIAAKSSHQYMRFLRCLQQSQSINTKHKILALPTAAAEPKHQTRSSCTTCSSCESYIPNANFLRCLQQQVPNVKYEVLTLLAAAAEPNSTNQ
ncbi:11728_t:CDS:1, partial [Ambispora leptoticha]